MSAWENPEKLTAAWGDAHAEALWNNFLAGYPVDWTGARVLDFGCAWGYLLKFLLERQGVGDAYGVDIRPLWEEMKDGSRPGQIPSLHLYAGDLLEISELQDIDFDVVCSSGTLMLLPPTELHAIVTWFYDHLKPGGACVLGTRTFLSHIGGDLQVPRFARSKTLGRVGLTTPLPHLLFPRRAIDRYFAEQGWGRSRYMNPFCAATYLMLHRRVGFEIVDARRTKNPIDSSVYEDYSDKLDIYDELELRTGGLTAHLRKPAKPRDTSALGQPATAQRSASSDGNQGCRENESANSPTPQPVSQKTKETQEWGRSKAEALWSRLFTRYDPVIDGATVLDLGCSWGYMLKFLAEEFRPRRLIGTDITPWWERAEHGWDYRRLDHLIEFHAGDLTAIDAIPEKSLDLILCTSVLQYMTPEQLEANLERAYELLRPGGEMLVRTRVFTSYIGADLHHDIELPYVHLFYGERELAELVRERSGKDPTYLNWLTASTYLAIYARTGFEALDVRRRMNSAAPEVMDRVGAAWPWISPEELLSAELETRLLRPIEAEDLASFSPTAAHPGTA